MAKYLTTLIGHEEIAQGVLEFHFTKPKGIAFRAGQNINIKLPELHYEDPKGPRRTFTLASAPHEEHLLVATRMTGSGFKRTLAELPAGTELEFMGPNGRFFLQDESERIVMIAAGIGITPFRSMIVDALIRNRPGHITLLYSNRDLERCAYHQLFDRLAKDREFRLPYVLTLTRPSKDWRGETGRIDMKFVQRHIENIPSCDYYLCGSPGQVDATRLFLQQAGVPEQRIFFEAFWGYPEVGKNGNS